MTAISITPGYPTFADTDGSPLNDGYVYIGLEYQDPITAPTTAFWDKEFRIPADQPLRTSGGYVVRDGSPAAVYTGAAYSILVQNKNLVTVYNAPSAVITNVTNDVEIITQYQGAHATDPIARNDGTPLQTGDLYFNTVVNELKVWTGTVWVPAVPGTVTVENFTGTGAQTAFNLATAPVAENNTQIYIDGVYQQKDTYTLSGATINFSTAPPNLSGIEVVTFSIASLGTTDASNVSYNEGSAGAVNTSVQAKLQETVSVKDFGAAGDGVTDDTAAIQAAIDYAEADAKVIYFPTGTFSVSTLSITNGIRGISCDGIIKGQGSAAAATIVIGETGAGVSNAVFNLRMDQSAGDLVAVKAYDIVGCTFDQCQIYGFVNSATTNHYAFWCIGPCLRNMFTNNHITLYDTPTQRGFGIALYGPDGGTEYGGFFTGALVPSAAPASENIIANNTIIDGSYAVSLQYAEECIVDGNYCRNQNHRGMYLASAALRNVISNNQIVDFLSSAVLLGYNAWHNVVSGNSCYSSGVYASGEAAININSGSSYNLISGNTIESPTNYGIYMGADMRSNVVQGNCISNHYLAAIGLDNDFIAVRPANSSYSRPNYGAPPAPYTAWSYVNSSDNVIKNNTIGIGYTGRNTAAIEVSQINGPNTTQVIRTIIASNDVISADNIGYNLWFYADTDGRFFGTNVTNNNFNSGNSEASYNASGATTWAARIRYYADNEQFDEVINGEPISFTDGDATPSVVTNSSVPSERLYQFANTTATDVTDFDNPYPNQQIMLRMDSNTTIKYNSSIIRTKGSVDVTGNSNDFIQFIHLPNGIWYETWRSF
jgi:parallel beta-helix repeat protein